MNKYKYIADGLFLGITEKGKLFLVNVFPFEIYLLDDEKQLDNPEFVKYFKKNNLLTKKTNYFNVEFIITTKCNLGCLYCHIREGKGYYGFEPIDMSMNVWRRSVDFLFELITYKFNNNEIEGDSIFVDCYYLGGEPLINFEAVTSSYDYCKLLCKKFEKKLGIKINIGGAISSNATLLNEDHVKYFKSNDFELSITIDGLNHDQHRIYLNGDGTLQTILNKFDIFEKLKYSKVKLFSVVPPEYVDEIENIIEFFITKKLFKNSYRVSIVPRAITRDDLSRGCSIPKNCFDKDVNMLDDSYVTKFSDKVNILYDKYNIDDRNLFSKLKELIFSGGEIHRCPAGLTKYSIDPYGNIWPCHQLVNFKNFMLGSIFDDVNLLINSKNRQPFEKRTIKNIKGCTECVLQSICPPLVDCPARAFIEENDLNTVSINYCKIYKQYLINRFDSFVNAEFLEEKNG
jgi:uncharacterized protein